MKKKLLKDLRYAITSPDVKAYYPYEGNTGLIVADILSSSYFLSNLTFKTGIKAGSTLTVENRLGLDDMTFSSDNCTMGEVSHIINPVEITTVRWALRDTICLDKLDDVLPMIQAAGANNQDLPYLTQYGEILINRVGRNLAKQALLGDTLAGDMIDGVITNAIANSGSLGYHNTYSVYNQNNVFSAFDDLLLNLTEWQSEQGVTVIVSYKTFDLIVDKYLKEYGIGGQGWFTNTGAENKDGFKTYDIPGKNVTLVGDIAMNGVNHMLAYNNDAFIGGTDMESDYETYDAFFSKEKRAFYIDIIFAFGYAVADFGKVSLIEFTVS
jgi:hypothetical protein